jgi:hypothetical protein
MTTVLLEGKCKAVHVHHAVTMCGGEEWQLNAFLPLAPDGSERSVSVTSTGHFYDTIWSKRSILLHSTDNVKWGKSCFKCHPLQILIIRQWQELTHIPQHWNPTPTTPAGGDAVVHYIILRGRTVLRGNINGGRKNGGQQERGPYERQIILAS